MYGKRNGYDKKTMELWNNKRNIEVWVDILLDAFVSAYILITFIRYTFDLASFSLSSSLFCAWVHT